MDLLNAALIVLNLIVTLAFALYAVKAIKGIPNVIQTVLDDVGGQLNEIFANPTIKKAYSILGSQSGEVRADAALRNKVADKALESMPIARKLCEYFGITPIEGLQLMNDPLLQPIIAGFMKQGVKMMGPGGYGNPVSSSEFGDQRLVKK